jgi:hypothetical protein
MYYVIIDMGHGATHEKRLSKESVKKLETETPASYAEAVMRDNPDIEAKLVELCRVLAKCDIHKDGTGIIAIIQDELTKATAKQASLGGKATYRRVTFVIRLS